MITPDSAVLVIVDVQDRLLPVIHEHETLVQQLTRLIRGAQVLDIPIVVTEQIPEKLGGTVQPLAELLTDVTPIAKSAFSCCGSPAFLQRLEVLHRPDVLIAGIETHVCVYQTARDLIAADYDVQVVADAVSSRTPQNREIGLRRMLDEEIVWTSVEMALMELVGEAGTEEFRSILPIIR